MIKEILVGLDGSVRPSRALPVASAVASALGAAISVVTVNEPGGDAWADEVWLDDACAEASVRPHRRLVVPAEDTVEALLGLGATPGTVLCLTAHGHGGLLDDALDPVAAALVARSTTPVLVVGPHASVPPRFDVVQLCLDGSDTAGRAVAAAATWSRQLYATPWLVTVSPLDVGVTTADVESVAVLEPAIRAMQDEGLGPEWDTLHGDDPADVLTEAAAKLSAAIVVAGTHGQSGLKQAILGSVAGGLVRRAPCPVLLVGPKAGVEPR